MLDNYSIYFSQSVGLLDKIQGTTKKKTKAKKTYSCKTFSEGSTTDKYSTQSN